jgi:hypothetical protein
MMSKQKLCIEESSDHLALENRASGMQPANYPSRRLRDENTIVSNFRTSSTVSAAACWVGSLIARPQHSALT